MRSPLGLTTVLLLALAASAGCVGTLTPVDDQGGDDGGGTVSVARQMFTDDVTPLLNAVCAGCHVGAAG
ncbi:MAG: hypothetical protein KC464_11725, partial [Myxococcales bacterium]|nr:hypothetical protein [Myxococcales bacterium]